MNTKEIVERLRKFRDFWARRHSLPGEQRAFDEAADLIEAQDAEIAPLREALEFIADAPDPGEERERSATFYRIHAAMLKQAAAKALGRETVSPEAFAWAEEWANSDEGRAALALQPKDTDNGR